MSTFTITTLLSTRGIGRRSVRWLLETCDVLPHHLIDLHEAIIETKRTHPKIDVPTIDELQVGAQRAEQITQQATKLNIQLVDTTSFDFPSRLRGIPDPPVLLYVKGNIACLTAEPAIAVVGTRGPTPFGYGSARRLGETLAEREIIVVSGLASGCDTAAHQGCLQVGGQTVAILAHGLDTVYPAENRRLAEEIVAMDGCLVSEYPPGTRGQRSAFVERDRLQSGMSTGVIVVETDVDGGTMHTARFCLKQHHRLACIVHSQKYDNHAKTRGNKQLITENNAFPISNKASLEQFIFLCTGRFRKSRSISNQKKPKTFNIEDNVQESFLDMVEP